MPESSDKVRRRFRAVPAAALLVCLAVFFCLGRELTYRDLALCLPENRFTAGALIAALYGVKSLTVFFPLLTLYLLSGFLFPVPAAVLVNLLGLGVCVTVPYLLGRRLGPGGLDRLRERYPRFRVLETLRRESGFQFAVLARAAGILPGDVVSLYFGCGKLAYPAYLAGSLLGLAPKMIAATVLGGQIADPGSAGFRAALGFDLAVALASLLACRRVLREPLREAR